MKKKCLFIDRDGTLVAEPPDEQVDAFDKISFLPGVFSALGRIVASLDFELVLVTNQDGLGTRSFPEEDFWPVHQFIMNCFKNEGIHFSEELIDRSFQAENLPTRKPGVALLQKYIDNPDYDLKSSYVIGDRQTDIQLADNLGARGILIDPEAFACWQDIADYLITQSRWAHVARKTKETQVSIELAIDGKGQSDIHTGIGFFDHMLDQICRHAQIDLRVQVAGDLEVDEHHSIEDTALVLGEAFRQALGTKKGLFRYGFALPMDDSKAQVLIDFGGRPWFIWKASFNREMIGGFPTELFSHFFKSFSDSAQCNLQISAEGENEHHKIEAIFKAFARAIRMAVKLDGSSQLPSTKESL